MPRQNKCYEGSKLDGSESGACDNCVFLALNIDGYCGAECLNCGGTLIAMDIEGFPMYQCNNCNVQFWHYDNPNIRGTTKERLE